MIKTRLEDLLERTFDTLGSPLSPRFYAEDLMDAGRVNSALYKPDESDEFVRDLNISAYEKELITSCLTSRTFEQLVFENRTPLPNFVRKGTYGSNTVDYLIFVDEGRVCAESISVRNNTANELLIIEYVEGNLSIDITSERVDVIYEGKPSEDEFRGIILKSIMKFISGIK